MKSFQLIGALLLISASSASFASTGQITFTGNVLEDTCEASVNGGGTDAAINLPTVPSSVFRGVGSTSGEERFTITLNNCAAAVPHKIAFDSADINPATGDLQFDGGGVAMMGIGLQLTNESMEPIDLRTNSNNPSKTGEPGQPIEFVYHARYIQSSALVSAGTADTTLLYSIRYD